MEIQLLGYTGTPSDLAVASARSCYSPTPLLPKEVQNWSKKSELLLSLFRAGHHTTLIHPHFTFLITGVSRLLIWRLLHSHPFYNSEQVSQRYAKVSPDSFYYPPEGERSRWESFYQRIYRGYLQLIDLLKEPIWERLPKFRRTPKETEKRAQEFARYLLPMGTTAHLYHTINLLTALRYIGGVKAIPEGETEAREFAEKLEKILLQIDPSIAPLIEEAKGARVEFPEIGLERWKREKMAQRAQREKRDKIGKTGEEVGKERDTLPQIEKEKSETPPAGVTSDRVFVTDLVYYPTSQMANYGEVLRFNNLYPDWESIGGFTSYLKLSLSADAQNQRHRRSVGLREKLEKLYTGADFYLPPIVAHTPKALSLYLQLMEEIYHFFEGEIGNIGFGKAVYALPNAHLIEVVERSDFGSFIHKSQMRLCLNAQEEIFRLTFYQVEQLKKMGVDGDLLRPPCQIRKNLGLKPYCPEGARYCGLPVWKLPLSTLPREI